MSVSLKIKLVVIGLVLLVFGGIILGCAPKEGVNEGVTEGVKEGATEKTIELKVAHFFPAVHPIETELVKDWKEAVEKATDGRVTVTSYPGETLIGASDVYEGVTQGVADVGIGIFGYTYGRFPLIDVFGLPALGSMVSAKVNSYAMWELEKEYQLEEMQDTKMLFVFSTSPAILMSKKPIKTLEDLKGLQIRAVSEANKTVEALGAIPVSLATPDIYEGLSRGIAQGAVGTREHLEYSRLAEVTDYVIETPALYTAPIFFTMNLDVWNSLSQEDQNAILAVNEELFEKHCGIFDKLDKSGIEFALNEGVEILQLSEDEYKRWEDVLIPLQEKWAFEKEQQGLPGNEILKAARKLVAKYEAQFKN